ncbi:heavy metal translocating P-type ATPase [Gloeocapsopsis dulcis]|uniref:Heavy metal translocating P-type ATPase n=1 Tax=Gloeocapsopsis dulcis AAB1 = 1H9 TaxID=1433147 RepID=A0A6N8FYC1_9CHRO|nr:heavy metal translocating P-type ATPase [Gloeocapsopsis dulcis]MUL38073.1 heavy metal translocating P-type ATPase [Gloeocapsopsis dulcis AAB1 = 1H9]WNN91761.1 heavy metal translocating P-type ATPase [Gloeocapsopsis dulcis]
MQLVPKTEPPQSIANSATQATETITLDIQGMKCAGCVKVVESQLVQNQSVLSACVNLVTEVAVVECAAGAVDAAELAENLTAAGFPTQPRYAQGEPDTSVVEPSRHRQEMQSALKQLIVASILLVLSSLGHFSEWGLPAPPMLHNIWLHFGLATATLIGPGRPILLDGWRGLRRNAPNMNTLVGLGTLTAYTASLVALLFPQLGWDCFFDEPVMLLGFILLGRTLEQQARGRAALAFRELLALQPQVARLIADPTTAAGRESVEIPADRVRVGEWLQVLPGDKIPVDGEVVAGKTTVNESMLTGEAMPVSKQPGDQVAAGTINQAGTIALRATRTGKNTTLAQIVTLVEAAQTRKAPVQKLADTVAGYFTYGVLTSAILTFVFWYFIGTHIWSDIATQPHHLAYLGHKSLHQVHTTHAIAQSPLLLSLKLAIAVMVVACPCALGLATPTAILVGTGVGAERGLLIKGGEVLERVHRLTTVVFDKTGTLTTGLAHVSDCIPLRQGQESISSTQHLLQLAAAVESGNAHPLATAIQQAAQQHNLSPLAAQDFYMEPGLGVSAQVAGHNNVLLGNQEWLVQHSVVIDEAAQQISQSLTSNGKTVVYVAVDNQLVGLIALTDTLRADAKATVDKLRQIGLQVAILTGDRQEVAEVIALQLGIDSQDIFANVRPDEKAAAISQLQSQRHLVAMVGDGINDTPALSQADVGIALKTGTDVAMETAEIVLMRDSLTDVVVAIELSRATFNKIRQNLFWAFAYNTLGIPIAAGALLPGFGFVLSPAAAGALMAFSSISVVTNSLLLRRFHKKGARVKIKDL